jgi:non-specific serine/threonine protein kinase
MRFPKVAPALLALALAACAPGASAPPAAIDQQTEPPLPEARQEVASAASDELGLWVIGGLDGGRRSTPTVFWYDGASWTRAPDLPVGLDHPSAAALGDAVYVAGGLSGGAVSRRVFALPGPRELAPLNRARAGLALVAVGGKLYALGGNGGGGDVAPAEEYDVTADRWTLLPPMPNPRNHVAGFAYRAMACAAGGRAPNSADVDCWDPASRRWTSLPGLPTPTSGAGGGTLGERVFVAGGEDPSAGAVIDQLAVLESDVWRVERMAAPRHGIALAAYRGRLWACGGASVAGLRPLATCTSFV